jgi:N-acetyl-anhydromuramyl-L-alanine amidase AmpD
VKILSQLARKVRTLFGSMPSGLEPFEPLPLVVDENGWLEGAEVQLIRMHSTWFYSKLSTPDGSPRAIVAHYTATAPNTAVSMARRRQHAFGTDKDDRAASWHVSIEADGSIIQMAPFTVGCWHALGNIPDVGAPNRTAIGIELVGHGKAFPETQVAAACRVWRAIARRYEIAREHAMVEHSALDPARRGDPGPVWMTKHAAGVLDYAYAD